VVDVIAVRVQVVSMLAKFFQLMVSGPKIAGGLLCLVLIGITN
jgi:hypothetical protein